MKTIGCARWLATLPHCLLLLTAAAVVLSGNSPHPQNFHPPATRNHVYLLYKTNQEYPMEGIIRER